MARKPVIELAGGKGQRQHIWEAIRRLARAGDEPFSEDEIWLALPREARSIAMDTIREYRRALSAAGILATVEELPPRIPGRYRLAKDEGLDAPRLRKDGTRVTQGLAQEQMWRTLRLMTCDTNARELAAHASTPSVPVAEPAAKDYLRTLHNAGYLECTAKGHGIGKGGIQARYRLLRYRNTGPRPPMVCRTKVVFDPNEAKVVWQPPVTEEDAIYGA